MQDQALPHPPVRAGLTPRSVLGIPSGPECCSEFQGEDGQRRRMATRQAVWQGLRQEVASTCLACMGEGNPEMGVPGACPTGRWLLIGKHAAGTGQRRQQAPPPLALLAPAQAPAALKAKGGRNGGCAAWAWVGQPATPAPVTARAPLHTRPACRWSRCRPGCGVDRALAGWQAWRGSVRGRGRCFVLVADAGTCLS